MRREVRYYNIPILRIAATLAVIFMVTYILIIGKAILQPFVVALLLFFFINTLANFFMRIGIRGKHLPASFTKLLATTIIFGLIFIVMFFGVSISITEVARKWDSYKPALVNMVVQLDNWSATQVQNLTGKEFGLEAGPVVQAIQNFDVNTILGKTQQAIGNVSVFLGIMILYLVFLLLEQRVFPNKMRAIFPDEEDYSNVEEILSRIGDSVFTYIKVKTIISLLTAVCTYVTLMLFGVKSAIFWAILTFILNYIPNVGSFMAVISISLVSFIQFAAPGKALILFVILTIIQQFFGGFVDPRMSGNRLNLSPLVIIVSLVFWGKVWGILGAFFCVPLTVIIFIILSNFEATRPIAILLSSKGGVDAPPKKIAKAEKNS